jgi:hypothetical protein
MIAAVTKTQAGTRHQILTVPDTNTWLARASAPRAP